MLTHELTETYLREELKAREEEGFEVEAARQALEAAAGQPAGSAGLRAVEEMLDRLPRRADFPYVEPSDLEGIRAERPAAQYKPPLRLPRRLRADRTLGGWLGRAAGCLLGKPCEGWSRAQIEQVLRLLGAWPLSDYWPVATGVTGVSYPSPDNPSLKENVRGMARDDDMDYPILNLRVLETYGPGFTTRQVGEAWLSLLPYHCVYTAERVAYRNLVNGLEPPATATHRNPYREWIGAQIRADLWGWAAAGNPELAAELAWRDAALSHTKNGIYGEMFFAAAIAAAFVESDLRRVLEVGLSQIPARCRLREAIVDTMRWAEEDAGWETTWERINQKYGHYDGVHTINNAAVVVMALLHGGGDFEKTITIAVMGGWDTDCNGATAGSVVGTMLGAKALPEKWIAPLRDRISSIVVGFTSLRISELARRTLRIQDGLAVGTA